MNIFDVINEVAVLCTTLFMMAVSTVWYSSLLFGRVWAKELGLKPEEVDVKEPDLARMMVCTFVSYATLLTLLAYLMVVAPLADVSIKALALFAFVFVAAALAPAVIWEKKSLRYYAITLGFMGIFIIGGMFILRYWPW